MSRVCTECNKHGTCAKEHKVASGKGWCSKFYQSRRALEADRDALRAELDRTKGELERVRRNHLRRMEHDAIDLTCGSFRFTERDHARLNRIIEGCRAALERKADA